MDAPTPPVVSELEQFRRELVAKWAGILRIPERKIIERVESMVYMDSKEKVEHHIYTIVLKMLIQQCVDKFQHGHAQIGTRETFFKRVLPRADAEKYFLFAVEYLKKSSRNLLPRLRTDKYDVIRECEFWMANCCRLALVCYGDLSQCDIDLICVKEYSEYSRPRGMLVAEARSEMLANDERIAALKRRNIELKKIAFPFVDPMEEVADSKKKRKSSIVDMYDPQAKRQKLE